nr:Sensor protein qseC [Klebsiella pneumoniae]
MKRLARLSLRLRLTLLFAVLTTAAGDGQRYRPAADQQKLDKLFDTQQLLFARRLSVMHFDELRAPPASLGEKKRYATGTSTTTRWRSPSSPATAKWCLMTARTERIFSGIRSARDSAMAICVTTMTSGVSCG